MILKTIWYKILCLAFCQPTDRNGQATKECLDNKSLINVEHFKERYHQFIVANKIYDQLCIFKPLFFDSSIPFISTKL